MLGIRISIVHGSGGVVFATLTRWFGIDSLPGVLACPGLVGNIQIYPGFHDCLSISRSLRLSV
jgi:hypothetical protein